jgi:hypothetical protein
MRPIEATARFSQRACRCVTAAFIVHPVRGYNLPANQPFGVSGSGSPSPTAVVAFHRDLVSAQLASGALASDHLGMPCSASAWSTWEHRLGVCLLGHVKRAGLSRRMFPLEAHGCFCLAGLNGVRMQARVSVAPTSDSARSTASSEHQAHVMTIRRLTDSLVKTQRKSQNSPSLGHRGFW